MRKCVVCGAYTFSKYHCNKKTIPPHPPRYNPDDKHILLKVKQDIQDGIRRRG